MYIVFVTYKLAICFLKLSLYFCITVYIHHDLCRLYKDRQTQYTDFEEVFTGL